jgi:hypothetical protein
MDRDELTALRDAIDVMLAWPDGVRDQVARWLTPEAAKPNGRGNGALAILGFPDNDLAPTKGANSVGEFSPRRSPSPKPAKTRRGTSPTSAKTAERKLIEVMKATPGATVVELARAVGGNRSAIGDRLRTMARNGAIEKDPEGRWRLAGEEARPMSAPSSS